MTTPEHALKVFCTTSCLAARDGPGLDDTALSTASAWAFSLGIGLGLIIVTIRRKVPHLCNVDDTVKPVSDAVLR